MAAESTESCSWCGRAIEPDDGWRVRVTPGARRAAFCRLEHMVPWSIQGAPWGAGEAEGEAEDAAGACAHCGGPVNDARVTLVRHRGEHRIADAFCSVDHLVAWAKSGGRWG